jgi:cytochrome c peroxidase
VETIRHFNLYSIVKPTGKISCTVAVFIIIICTAHFKRGTVSFNEKVDDYFKSGINDLSAKLNKLKSSSHQTTSLNVLKQQFVECRLSYKKLAILSEYFNIYETRFINGPALPRAEDGTPDIIIPPKGFQAIEEILYGDPESNYREKVRDLTDDLLQVIEKMKTEPDRVYKFHQELVWDAIRAASVRLVTLGITGFDSPVALHSITEATTSIAAIKSLLKLFSEEPGIAGTNRIKTLNGLLDAAGGYLAKQKSFPGLDRLHFISTYFNPFYKQLVVARQAAGIDTPQGRSPVNFNSLNIFSKDFFDITFFSPGVEYGVTPQRAALGKKLFSDPILSGTNRRSCAGCHNPKKAFTDGIAVPFAMDNKTRLKRNTPTLWNSMLQTRQFFDTRADMLENQLKEVVHDVSEMEGSLAETAKAIKNDERYEKLFAEAYPTEKEPISPFNIANAISSYIRTLVSLDSKLDRYMRGNKSMLSAAEKNGFNLFTGKAKCATCHFLPLFNGLVPPDFTETETEVLGVPATKNKLKAKLDADPGRFEITRSVIHRFSFKTPTLRNIALTGPYMHNGVFTTLNEVMDFYNAGGGAGLNISPENQTLPTDKLNLTKQEIADIIAFMKSLTDPVVSHYRD